jgi:hypothetical protein
VSDSTWQDEQLFAYLSGDLAPDLAARLGSQLEGQPALREQLEACQELLALLETDDSVTPSAAAIRRAAACGPRSVPAWLQHLQRAVAALVFDSGREPALAGFRRAGTGPRQLSYEAEAGRLDLEMTRGTADSWLIRGQMTGELGSEPTVVALESGTDLAIDTTTLDPRGRFRLEVRSGRLDLVIGAQDGACAMVAPDIALD